MPKCTSVIFEPKLPSWLYINSFKQNEFYVRTKNNKLQLFLCRLQTKFNWGAERTDIFIIGALNVSFNFSYLFIVYLTIAERSFVTIYYGFSAK